MDKEYVSPMMAIRQKCLDCSCGSMKEVKSCVVRDCSLWRFRLGINPNTKKNKKNPLLSRDFYTQ